MDNIMCKKGCCLLQIFPKIMVKKRPQFPFEKRKAGVLVCCDNKVLLTQSYNNYWGIPKGCMEPYDHSTIECAIRELREETGLKITLNDKNLYKLQTNCFIYKFHLKNKNMVKVEKLPYLDSTGIGWVNLDCAFDFNLNSLTRKILKSLGSLYL